MMKDDFSYKLISIVLACCIAFMNCGGGTAGSSDSGGGSDSNASTLTISGSIAVPVSDESQAGLNVHGQRKSATAIEYGQISALIAIIIIPALSLLGQNLQAKFTPVASQVPTDSDGGFSLHINTNVGSVSSDSGGGGGDLAQEGVVVNDGDVVVVLSDVGVAGAYEVNLNEETDEIDLGQVDLEDTLAYENLVDTLEDAGADFSDPENPVFDNYIPPEFNVGCYLGIQNELWTQAGDDTSGLGAKMGSLKELAAAAIINGDPSELGAGNLRLIRDIANGDMEESGVSVLADEAAHLYGGNADVRLEAYNLAVDDNQAMNNLYVQTITADPNAVALRSHKSQEISEIGNLCDAVDSDADALHEVVATMLGLDNIDNFSGVFGTVEGVSSFLNVIKSYQGDDGDFVFEDNPDGLKWDPKAMAGVLTALIAQGIDPAEFDDNSDTILAILNEVPEEGASENFSPLEWGEAMMNSYLANPAPFADGFAEEASFWAIQVEDGLPIEGLGEDQFNLEAIDAYSNNDWSSCNPDSLDTCADQFDATAIEGVIYVAPPADAICGDGICAEGEETLCSLDCGYW